MHIAGLELVVQCIRGAPAKVLGVGGMFYDIIWPWLLLENTLRIHFLPCCWVVLEAKWGKELELTELFGEESEWGSRVQNENNQTQGKMEIGFELVSWVLLLHLNALSFYSVIIFIESWLSLHMLLVLGAAPERIFILFLGAVGNYAFPSLLSLQGCTCRHS